MIRRLTLLCLASTLVTGLLASLPTTARAVGVTYTVDSNVDTADSNVGDGSCDAGGVCTLRAALQESNASATDDTIEFAIGTGPVTITAASDLPTITGAVVLSGATQPGAQALPRITVDGGTAGFQIAASDVTIDAIAITGSTTGVDVVQGRRIALTNDVVSGNGDGVDLTGPAIGSADPAIDVTFLGDRIGTNAAGTVAVANTGDGIHARGKVDLAIGSEQAAGRNVISGNGDDGVDARGSSGTQTLEGARIGVSLGGGTAIGNGNWGVDADSIVVGTYANGVWQLPVASCTGACSVISGNGHGGIRTFGGGISGNMIGVDGSGSTAIPNGDTGVSATDEWVSNNVISGNGTVGAVLDNSIAFQNFIGTNAQGTAALGNGDGSAGAAGVVLTSAGAGYDAANSGNVISGNDGPGVRVPAGGSLYGNFIGTDLTGKVAIANTVGVVVTGTTTRAVIGGSLSFEGNVIAGNSDAGIELGGVGGGKVLDNRIGVAVGGAILGNGATAVTVDSDQNDISDNDIAGTTGAGIEVDGGKHTRMSENHFSDIGGIPIDLNGDGPTPNDPGDIDTGPNGLLNTPVIDEVDTYGDLTFIHYHVDPSPDGGPNVLTVVEFYADDSCPTSGTGGGSHFLTSASVHQDGTGVLELSQTLAPTDVISATRTEGDIFDNPFDAMTSEFSACAAQLIHPADTTPPVFTAMSPSDGDLLSSGDPAASATVQCDDGLGTGVASCFAQDVTDPPAFPGGPVTHHVTFKTTDHAGNSAQQAISYTVVAGSIQTTLSQGGIVTTDPSGTGPNNVVTIQTTLQSYAGGLVDMRLRGRTSRAPVPYQYIDQEVAITAPDSPIVGTPQILTFQVAGSAWDRGADSLRLFRDGALVGHCTTGNYVADPDPCATRAVRLLDGDVQVVVYGSSVTGTWNFGWRVEPFHFRFLSPSASPPVVNVVRKDSAIGAWFSLGGDMGRHVFQQHSPTFTRVPCWAHETKTLNPRMTPQVVTYHPFSNSYEYGMGHPLKWSGTCGVLRMAFIDGTVARARYRLR